MWNIHHAARAGNLPELRRLLAQGAAVDAFEETTGHTALMAACLSPLAGPDALSLLLDHGANIHVCMLEKTPDVSAIQTTLENGEVQPDTDALLERLPAELRESFAASLEMLKNTGIPKPDPMPLIALAVREASCEKIRLLIERGADVRYHSARGYTLLTFAAYDTREDVIDLLLAAGAPLDGVSDYNESALRVLSNNGRFETIRKLLAHGADPAPLQWSELQRAIALGSLQEMEVLLAAGADTEATDSWERTAFLLSIHTGDTQKTALLLERGARRDAVGRCGKPPLQYALDKDDAPMLAWLIAQGFDIQQPDQFEDTPLKHAVENSAIACFHALIAAGADWRKLDTFGSPLIGEASHPEIIKKLIELGADPGQLASEALRKWIGLRTVNGLPLSKQDFLTNRTRRFGTTNPERMDVPFWQAMVRCGWSGYQASREFKDEDSWDARRQNPVWSHQRFGMSLTKLPDGRFVQIAGEHEDHYDPDFCIYNDVIVHDGKGGFDIFGYPEEVFPPTDFHSATWVAPWIYIIGNLGYQSAPGHDQTPVYRLHVDSREIERVNTRGEAPGHIHSHKAKLLDGCIHVTDGKRLALRENGERDLIDNTEAYVLDLATLTWRLAAP